MLEDVYYLNNGYPMPKVGLGVYKITDDEMNVSVATALDAGYRAFDTAYFYKNEIALGNALKKLTFRVKIYLSHQNYGMIIRVMTVQLNFLLNLLKI